MSGSFWGGMLLALVIVQILVIWSIRRHRDPNLEIECDQPIDELMPSLSGLTLGTAVAGNRVEVHENGAFFDVLIEHIPRTAPVARGRTSWRRCARRAAG
jgi:cardiolipin synthase